METNDRSVQFAGGILGRQRHVCAFFYSTDEEHRVLRSFIKDGFDLGDKAFHLVDPELREEHLRRLTEEGINVQEAMDTGQLEVRRGKTVRSAEAGLTRTPGWCRSNKYSSPGRQQGTRRQDSWRTWNGRSSTYQASKT